VRTVLRGGEAEPRGAEHAGIEIDLSAAILGELELDGVGGALDRGQTGRIDELFKSPVRPQNILSHFGTIIFRPQEWLFRRPKA